MGLISLAVLGVAAFLGYGTARRFVRDRLRYVEKAQSPMSAIIAGAVAFAVAVPVFSLISWLPFVALSVGSAAVFGASVGMGVGAGVRDIKTGYRLHSGS
ncbi:MAG: hypothetical protein K2X99_05655 [Gemmatimonadaceae bacterium]|nr:hypothetical protein [Gemmatimonadaceae bacterium]